MPKDVVYKGIKQTPLSRGSLGWWKSGVPIGMFKAMEMMEVEVEAESRVSKRVRVRGPRLR